MRFDIFCTVIDNYGDIGITWRLARQLVAEYGVAVCLWVDDLASFQRIRPEIDPARATQSLLGVEVRHWHAPLPADARPGDVVIEALACALPEAFVEAMAVRRPKPVWINLEYLSAEAWVAGCHGLPSPHARLPLVKYFFFPGWQAGTGGVLREQGLAAAIREFQADNARQEAFWRALGVPPRAPDEARLSLFAYENAALDELLRVWAASATPMRCLVPIGRISARIASFFGIHETKPGDVLRLGQLTVHCLPFLDQDSFDRLLWACDLNFVRGEDSFVRACWAGAPLVWQAYRQEEDAHWPKIEAFLAVYGRGLAPEHADALGAMWRAWNSEQGAGLAWNDFWARRESLRAHHRAWMDGVARLGDLADNLMHFCQEKL
jgi:uncharacterized repeat protein (TIGR03837 family)